MKIFCSACIIGVVSLWGVIGHATPVAGAEVKLATVEVEGDIMSVTLPEITLPAYEIGRLYRKLKAEGWTDIEIARLRTRIGMYLFQAIQIQMALDRMMETKM